MNPQRGRRKVITLGFLVLLAALYAFLYYTQPALTGSNQMDGIIGVLLGLYIGSHPAANFLDMLFFGREEWPQHSSRRTIILWVAVNVFVLFVAWLVIMAAMNRFMVHSGDEEPVGMGISSLISFMT